MNKNLHSVSCPPDAAEPDVDPDGLEVDGISSSSTFWPDWRLGLLLGVAIIQLKNKRILIFSEKIRKTSLSWWNHLVLRIG